MSDVEAVRPPTRHAQRPTVALQPDRGIDGLDGVVLDLLERQLAREIAFPEQRMGQRLRLIALQVLGRRVEGMVRREGIDAQQPRLAAVGVNERDRLLRRPGRLVQRRRRSGTHERVHLDVQLRRIDALVAKPVVIGVVLAGAVFGSRIEAPAPSRVAVLAAHLGATGGSGQVELTDQSAMIAGLGEQPAHRHLSRWKRRIAVSKHSVRRGVAPGHKARPARRAQRVLHIGAGERDAVSAQRIDGRGAHVRIAERADRVPSLLIRAKPKHVGPFARHRLAPATKNSIY